MWASVNPTVKRSETKVAVTRVREMCLPCYRRWPKSPAISSSAAWPLYLQQGKWWSKSSATDAWLRVARPNMPSGQSEEYHIVTVQSDQARVGFSSSGKHIRFKARGAAVAGGRGRRRTSGMARLHESTRKTSTSTSLHLPAASAEGEDGEGEVGWSSGRRCRSAGGCVCGERCVCVCWLAPHTILCPHMGRNFLEIVRYHRSRRRCGMCAACVCMGCMPSGQSEEYHIVTVQSDQARVGFSSSGSIFGALGVRP